MALLSGGMTLHTTSNRVRIGHGIRTTGTNVTSIGWYVGTSKAEETGPEESGYGWMDGWNTQQRNLRCSARGSGA